MERIALIGALLLFLASVSIIFYVRRGLVQYTTQLMNCLDAVLSGAKEIDFQEDQETLNGKVQTKIRQIYEIMELKSEENIRQRQQLEAMISDISHQVKTPIASIQMYHDLLERKELTEKKREEFLCAAEHQVDKLTPPVGKYSKSTIVRSLCSGLTIAQRYLLPIQIRYLQSN